MKHSEALKAAKEIISKPENWTQNYFAKSKEGYHFYGDSQDAVCFCSLGAIQSIVDRNNWDINHIGPSNTIEFLVRNIDDSFKEQVRQADIKEGYIKGLQGYGFVSRYNDSHSHTEVLELFDKAIALAEKEGE